MKSRRSIIPLFVTFLGLCLWSCASDDPVIGSSERKGVSNSYKIPFDDALQFAYSILAEIDSSSHTRLGRSVANVDYLSANNSTKTRSGIESNDTLFYLINFNDEMGFALMSADRRSTPVYAISGEGHLLLSDTVDNKGVALFMQHVRDDMEFVRKSAPADTFPTGGNIGIGGGDINVPIFPEDDYKKELVLEVAPKLGYYPSRWHQNDPLNCMIEHTIYQVPPKAGCGAIAVAMVCSGNQYPKSFRNNSLAWDEINQANPVFGNYARCRSIAQFIADIGKDDCLGITYSADSSYNSGNKYVPTFKTLGYDVSNGFKKLSSVDAKTNYPFLTIGSIKGSSTGHAWVVDGFRTYKITSNMYVNGYTYLKLYHCVWGWSGINNGYFNWSVSRGFGKKPEEYGDNDSEDYDSRIKTNYSVDVEFLDVKKK